MTKILLFTFSLFLSLSMAGQSDRNVLEFDSSNPESLVNAGVSSDYSQPVFTVESWVNISAGNGTIISNVQYVDGEGSKGFSIRLNGQKAEFVMAVGLAAGDWAVLTATDDLPLDTWVHVAAVYDGSTAEIFYNGISQGTLSNPNPIQESSLNLYLGEHPTWANRRLSGQLSDVRIWSVARTAAEIQSTMNNYLNGDETGLIANWKLNEGSGTQVVDQVTGNAATAGAGTSWVSGVTLSITKDVLSNLISLYPNPSNGIVFIKNSERVDLQYEVYSMTGKKVKSGKISNDLDYIDLSTVSQGVYLLKGYLGQSQFHQKILIN